MRSLIGALAVMAMATGPAWAAAERYTIDPEYTVPTFEISHLGFTTQRGRFNRATGNVVLDFAAGKGSVELIIDTTSIDMSSAAWSRHLADPGLFNVDKYPTMTFKSSNLTFKDGKVVAADGELTLVGITKPVHLTVTGFRCLTDSDSKKIVCGANVSANIKRSEFGLTKYIPEVSDDITVRVPVEAVKN